MLRFLIIFAAFVVLVGCQSRFGGACGNRVPPPATGSYGVPNTYYPNVGPRASSAPAGAPRVLNSSLSTWRSVDDANDSPTTNDAVASALDNETTGSSVRTAPSTTSTVRAPTIRAASGQMRLKGMPINEVKPPVAPATFLSPVSEAEFNAEGKADTSDSESASGPPSNTLRNSSASVRSDSWQSRSAPAPNRVAGG